MTSNLPSRVPSASIRHGSPVDKLRRFITSASSSEFDLLSNSQGLRNKKGAGARDAERVATSETQTETTFPTWISILPAQVLNLPQHQSQSQRFAGPTALMHIAELEFMRRLHCQEYKQLQSLRELIRQHVTALGATVYDVCAYKDVALAMKERFAVGPVADLVMLSSKLFRRCSDLSRSLSTFFNICFADDFCDRDFDFTDHRLAKIALARTEARLSAVTMERDDLRRKCREAEEKLEEYGRSHAVLKEQRDEADERHSRLARDMAALFEKSVEEVLHSESSQLRSTEMAATAHQLVAPARSIAMQSVDTVIDKLSNVVSSLKQLHEDVSGVDFGGAMRTAIRNCDGLCTNSVTKLAHVRDGIKSGADALASEVQSRRRAVELSVLHVLAAEKMRAKLRDGRQALEGVRARAIACSDLVREARVKHVLRRQGEERQRQEHAAAAAVAAAAAAAAHSGGKISPGQSLRRSASSMGLVPAATAAPAPAPGIATADPDLEKKHELQRRAFEALGGDATPHGDGPLAPSLTPTFDVAVLDDDDDDVNEQALSAEEPFVGANEFSDHIAMLLNAISDAGASISHDEELTDVIESLSSRVPQVMGVAKQLVPEGRDVLDSALENLHSAPGDEAAAFRQFAEMAQFMREMFEERIRELEEKKADGSSAGAGASSAAASKSSHSSNDSESAKTDAEVLEEQALQAIETWRKRRRGENVNGKAPVADALRELDKARKEQEERERQQQQQQLRRRGGGGGRRVVMDDDDDNDSDDDVAEAPSLVIHY